MKIISAFTFIIFFYATTISGMSIDTITTTTKQHSSCGSWIPYTDEKCVRIADVATFQTKQEAEAVCPTFAETEMLDDLPRLVTVQNEREQKALQKLLFEELHLLDHVWLGIDSGDDGNLRWNNRSKLFFSNFEDQNITGKDRECVQMESGQGVYPTGRWARVNCRKRNIVVCEKTQVWTVAKLQNTFLDFKTRIERETERPQQGKELAKTEIVEENSGTSLSNTKMTLRCGDWKPYKDQKCLKIAINAGHYTKEDAEKVCQSFSKGHYQVSFPRLVTIKTNEEQKFLQHFLFDESNLVDNVWIGLQKNKNDQDYEWNDGTSVVYSNWANQNTTDDRTQCIQIASGQEVTRVGLWLKVNCKKVGVVVCESTQVWSLEFLQSTFLNYKLEQELLVNEKERVFKQEISSLQQRNTAAEKEIVSGKQRNEASEMLIAKLQQRNEATEKELTAVRRRHDSSEREIAILHQNNKASESNIDNLRRNQVPVGFIYVELPGQQPPSTLWPQAKWQDVSSKYAGLFFRVVGGRSAPFGHIQDGACPRLEQVEQTEGNHVRSQESNPVTIPADGSWSWYLWDGTTGGNNIFMRFRLLSSEIRPRNQAVKVWQRIQ